MSKIIMKSNLGGNLIFITDQILPAPGMIIEIEEVNYLIESIDIHNNLLNLKPISTREAIEQYKESPAELLPFLVNQLIKNILRFIIRKL